MTVAGHKTHRSGSPELWFHRRMEIVEFAAMTDERRRALEGDEADPFDEASAPLHYRRKDRHVGLSGGDGLVASTGIVMAEVEVAGERFPVVGIGGVIVRASHRGRGLAREVVGLALDRAAQLGPPFALLFCLEDRAGLYRKLGFATIEDEVLIEQPDGYTKMPLRTMWRALQPGASWPRGQVTLHGLPF
jgi:predicted N-acetyltransferase YhbS